MTTHMVLRLPHYSAYTSDINYDRRQITSVFTALGQKTQKSRCDEEDRKGIYSVQIFPILK